MSRCVDTKKWQIPLRNSIVIFDTRPGWNSWWRYQYILEQWEATNKAMNFTEQMKTGITSDRWNLRPAMVMEPLDEWLLQRGISKWWYCHWSAEALVMSRAIIIELVIFHQLSRIYGRYGYDSLLMRAAIAARLQTMTYAFIVYCHVCCNHNFTAFFAGYRCSLSWPGTCCTISATIGREFG